MFAYDCHGTNHIILGPTRFNVTAQRLTSNRKNTHSMAQPGSRGGRGGLVVMGAGHMNGNGLLSNPARADQRRGGASGGGGGMNVGMNMAPGMPAARGARGVASMHGMGNPMAMQQQYSQQQQQYHQQDARCFYHFV
jgi:hypothetical protein